MEDENRKLYPLRFIEEGEDRMWGHQSYHLADLGHRESMVAEGWLGGSTIAEVMETYLERVVGDDVFEFYGLQFPVMVKTLDIAGKMPLKVGIDDVEAFDRYDALGKTVLWHVTEAGPDALIYIGFNRNMDAGDLYARCVQGKVEEVLNAVHPHPGDTFLIRPGTVFAAGQGLKIVEVSQSSELSFNIHGWGMDMPEGEEILLEEAIDLIDYSQTEPEPLAGDLLADLPEFKVAKLDLKAPVRITMDHPGSYALYTCVKGEVSIQVPDNEGKLQEYVLKAGRSVLMPSELTDFYLVPLNVGTVLLETMSDPRKDMDEPVPQEDDDEDFADPHVKTW